MYSCFIVVALPLPGAERRRSLTITAKTRLPAIYSNREFVENGGLMFYGANSVDLYRRAATYVDKMPSRLDLPVQQPTKFALVINLKTANKIGVTIPPNVLTRADRVIIGVTMAELETGKPVSLEELMVSTLAMTDALTKLLIEPAVAGVIEPAVGGQA